MERSSLEAALRMLTAIWFAFTMVVIMMGAGAYTLLRAGIFAGNPIAPSLLPMIAPVLVVMMVGGLVVGRRLEKAIPGNASAPEKTQRYAAARLVAMASQEGLAMAMMILGLLAGASNWIVGAAVVGVWTVFLARPRREDLEALLRS